MFSNTLDGDYNNSPSDAQSASNAWSASSSTVTHTETDTGNDAGQPVTGSPRTDYQANPNANIYTQHGPYINKLTVDINILI